MTWTDRDLPVLKAIVELDDEGAYLFGPRELMKHTGLPYGTIRQALIALAGEQPPFFDYTDGSDDESREIAAIKNISGHARRTVGTWPTPESLAEQIIAGLNAAAEQAPDEEQRSRLQRAAASIAGVGRDVTVNVIATALGQGFAG
jgi:hypothetical protein